MIRSTFFALLAVAAAASLSACGGGSGSPSTSSTNMGTLRVGLTDAPACGYDAVNVTIQKVRVNQSASASDTDAGWTDITLNPALRVDLLTLSNGALATLGQAPLAAGHYSQLRLVLAANDSGNPLANSVVPTGGQETALSTPSGQQSGVKLNADFDVAANQLADIVLDFNACKSVVHAGASGQYQLKPVITVTPNYISGVSGYVDPTIANGSTLITLQQEGQVVKATAPDSTGQFLLEPVAPGSYDLVVTAPDHASAVVTGVTVADSTVTALNSATTQLALASASDGAAAGVITSTTTPIDASVAALQTLANGDKVDIGDTSADPTTGTYTLSLPASAPTVAMWSATGALTFAADSTAGANYTLSASSTGMTQTAGPFTVTAGAAVTNNFAF